MHYFHCELVVIGCDVRRCVYRGKLVLCGRNFVVLCFSEDSQLPELVVEVCHVCGDARLYDAEIVVVKLLPLRGLCTEKRSSAENKVAALFIHFLVDEEVFLFGPD